MTEQAWPPEFSTRRQQVDLAEENTPATASQPFNPDKDPIHNFMCDRDGGSLNCQPRADLVSKCCAKPSIDDPSPSTTSSPKVALLDERTLIGGRSEARTRGEDLTVTQLRDRLLRPRFYRQPLNQHAPDSSGRTTGLEDEPQESAQETQPTPETRLDAERRSIFITDLSRDTVLVLIATASPNQELPLQNALYRHFAKDIFMDVAFPSTGLAMFELAMHLPFQAWRPSEGITPPPGSYDAAFLDPEGANPGYISQAIYSCVVAGSDEWRWICYCFIDTKFDPTDGGEAVTSYVRDGTGAGGMLMDPCTHGKYPLEPAKHEPREYFLMVFESRLRSVTREWLNVVQKIESSVEAYDQKQRSLHHLDDRTFHQLTEWVSQMKCLIPQVATPLSRAAATCQKFLATYTNMFDGRHSRCLKNIGQLCDDLERISHRLDDTTSKFTQCAASLTFKMDVYQKGMTQDSRGISMILAICTPFLLTFGVFSMDVDVRRKTFPSLLATPTPVTFLAVLTCITLPLLVAAWALNLLPASLRRMRRTVERVAAMLQHAIQWLEARCSAKTAPPGPGRGGDLETGVARAVSPCTLQGETGPEAARRSLAGPAAPPLHGATGPN